MNGKAQANNSMEATGASKRDFHKSLAFRPPRLMPTVSPQSFAMEVRKWNPVLQVAI